jgi:asparagine synthase (glutamine-hydrolysing)
MCGINGIISWSRDVGRWAATMNHRLAHRGPDGDGVFIDGPLALGHVRLSILDLTSAGAQPMRFRRWMVSYNGEIYNFREIQKKLVDRGYSFDSRSDTEVLLKAWDCWGHNCLPMLEGMFAFCMVDTIERRLHLCRDGYGIKPLFYSHIRNELLFSSELPALARAQSTRPEPDRDALAVFLALHYVPAPQTGWTDLHKLRAGHSVTATYSGDVLQVAAPVPWHKPFAPVDSPNGRSLEDLDRALARSIRQQMVSDVPVGAFLSGGVDSSLICHYATQVSSEPLHTFSIGFSDAGPEYDESHYAREAAKVVGAYHHPVHVELGKLSHRIDDILDTIGELNADTSVFLNHIICEEARRHVTVCLSGAGGDELFGGYFRHQALLALCFLNKVPAPVIRMLLSPLRILPQNRDNRLGNLCRRVIRFLEQRQLPRNDFLSLIRQDSVSPQDARFFDRPPMHSLVEALQFDFNHFLGDNILGFTDKMSMLHSLEVRVPFLDPGVVGLAENLRNDQRVTVWEKKILLKQLAVQYFPRNLIYRKKQGFAAPVEVWLRQLNKSALKERCLSRLTDTLVGEVVIEKIIENFLDHKRDLSLQIYALIIMNRWHDTISAS